MNNPISSATGISVLKDPFSHDKIKSIWIHGDEDFLNRPKWQYTGHVDFKNGDTSGSQGFKADTLGELLKKMEVFIKDLEVDK